MCEENTRATNLDLWNRIAKMNPEEKGSVFLDLSNNAYEERRFVRSLTLAESAHDAFKVTEDYDGLIEAKVSMAYSYKSIKREDEALESMREAIELLNTRISSYEWDCRRTLVTWLYEAGDLPGAIEQMNMCLEHHLYEMDYLNAGYNYMTLAFLSCEMDKCADSLRYLDEARKLLQSEKQVENVADVDIQISSCQNHLMNGNASYHFALKAVSVFEVSGNSGKKALAYTQFARALITQERYSEALPWLDCAEEIVTEIKPVNFYALYQIQNQKIRAFKALGRESEVESLERSNSVINETLQFAGK